MNKPTKPNTSDQQRGISVVAELFFTVATIGATVLAVALRGPKIPPASGE